MPLGDPFPHQVRRVAYIADNDYNADIDTALADVLDDMEALRTEGRRLLVHCHGGASRTALVLRAWLMRTEEISVDEATAHATVGGLTSASGTRASRMLWIGYKWPQKAERPPPSSTCPLVG